MTSVRKGIEKMAEYIERKTVLDILQTAIEETMQDEHPYGIVDRLLVCDTLKRAGGRIIDALAADIVPVVHGKWVEYPECLRYENAYSDDQIVCSVCESVWNILDNCTEGFNYCPNCGSRMDGGT